MDPTQHRAGKLKQQNKSHKSTVKSKRESKRFLTVPSANGGRARSGSQRSTASSSRNSSNRMERKQKAVDLRKQKRSDVVRRRRMGGGELAPRVVCVVSLSDTIPEPIENYSRSIATSGVIQHNSMVETHSFADKSRLTFINTTMERDPVKVLDACKVADIVVFVIAMKPSDKGDEIDIKSNVSGGLAMVLSSSIDEKGRELITLIKAQGLPTPMGIIEGLDNVPAKHRLAAKRNLTTFFQQELNAGNEMKVLEMKVEGDEFIDSGKAMVRVLNEIALRTISWRSERSYLLGLEKIVSPNGEMITGVRGHLRGRPLSVHHLVHVTGQGTFRLERISFPVDPATTLSSSAGKMEMDPIVPDPGKLPPLKEEADPDPTMGEQTWPLQEELDDVASDDAMEVDNEGEPNEGRPRRGTQGSRRHSVENDDAEETKSKKEDADPSKDFLKAWGVDVEDDEEFDWGDQPLNKPAKTKKERAKMDLEFPDETDVFLETSARDRYASYRGLKSFRSSPWHPTESLPREYGFIHQLKNYKRAQKLIMQEAKEIEASWLTSGEVPPDCAAPGSYVELHFEGVGFANTPWVDPLVIGSLMPHEQRLSLLNCLVQPREVSTPVESRDDLIMHVGFWRRPVRPIFSEHNLNSDKHKMERFMEAGRWTVCSSYAPITFGSNVPVLLFLPSTGELAATGTVLNVDPNRIILKKVVLTAVPFRIKKRWCVARKMFCSPEDVAWFKPVELYTKYGASGRILESVGTHGSMKCQFDRVINQRDTICMALYKRVFPRRTQGMFSEIQEEDDLSDDEKDGV